MQDRDGAGRALQLLVILAEGAHRLPATVHHQRIDDILVRKGPRSETYYAGYFRDLDGNKLNVFCRS
jgi:hypothetical protein